jgi:hypothetical protein
MWTDFHKTLFNVTYACNTYKFRPYDCSKNRHSGPVSIRDCTPPSRGIPLDTLVRFRSVMAPPPSRGIPLEIYTKFEVIPEHRRVGSSPQTTKKTFPTTKKHLPNKKKQPRISWIPLPKMLKAINNTCTSACIW